MAEINQPAPVKPIWPTRREQQPKKRNPPDLSDRVEERKRKESSEPETIGPGIDEYV